MMQDEAKTLQPQHLSARGLVVKRGRATLLDKVDFGARGGELVGILGPSGSGKSTLLMALSGFRPPDAGAVLLRGQDLVQGFDELKREIGFVPQDDVVPRGLTVEKVLGYAAALRLPDFTDEARQGRDEGALRKLGLEERRALAVAKLSGGQRKRVSVAVELLTRPPLLFADEPTSGLDPALEEEVMRQLKALAQEGRVVVVTTHILSSLHLLDVACVLYQGHLVYFGPPSKLKAHFEVEDLADVYRKLPARPASEWRQRFGASEGRKLLLERLA
jgi:ABC-type multidrug transport system ATPase subunit